MAQNAGASQSATSLFDEGLALHRAGSLAQAERRYEAALRVEPGHFDALHMLGVVLIQTGRPAAAVEQLSAAVRAGPMVAAAHINLAAARNEVGDHAAALASCDRAVTLQPASAPAHGARGNALAALGRLDEALASYDHAIALNPAWADAHYNRANVLRDLGRLEIAVGAYDRAVSLRPGYVEALNNRAAVLSRLKQFEAALASYDAALAARPDSAEAHANRAKALNDLRRSDEALAACEQALALRPLCAEALNNRAVALHDLRRPLEAIAAAEEALAARPDYAEALNNIGIALYDLRRPADAVASFDRALALAPDFAVARVNRATSLLSMGDLKQGFDEYRWRWRAPDSDGLSPRLPCPLWEGEDLAGKRILVHCEQGYGDTLQFVRYAAPLARMAAGVTVLTNAPLVGLLRSIAGIEVMDRVAGGAPFDFQVPMLCLPRLFGTTLANVPAEVPYLAADPGKTARWAERLAALGGALKVGLVWAGASRKHDPGAYATDRRRSLTLAQLGPLADVSGVRFISLQKDEPALQAAAPPPGMALSDVAGELRDFGDTAALVTALDLVITVDTSVAHLAGALGKPVWVLSRYEGCWRWLSGREDSPWYPTARILHQPAPGDWDEVVRRAAATLGELV